MKKDSEVKMISDMQPLSEPFLCKYLLYLSKKGKESQSLPKLNHDHLSLTLTLFSLYFIGQHYMENLEDR